ncbi:MAG: phosphoglucosamine mutase [Calditrichia bacterium]
MKATLMRSVSGLRGIVGESLLPEVIVNHIAAFAHTLESDLVVVGRDSRVSGPFVMNLVKGTFAAMGKKVIEIGIVPTPTVQLMVEQLHAGGGIAITASHNPVQWNGLKFIGSDGLFLPPEKIQRVFDLADKKEFQFVAYEQLKEQEIYEKAVRDHIEKIMELPYVSHEMVKEKKFKVVVDTVNGAGGTIIPALLEEFGCQVITLNQEPTGLFAHTPEPLPENLKELSDTVIKEKADFGIAVDPDVDRCALVDNHGVPLGEEYTLAIAVKCILSKKLGPVVVNLSTSRVIEDIVIYYNSILHRTPVGEIHVAKKMEEIGAVVGGEGNGGVILPDIHLGRDAPVAVALTLQLLAESGMTMEELKNSFPQYYIVKDKMNVDQVDPDRILAHFKQKFAGERLSELDGLRIDLADHWIHLRKSNTEPIIRIMVEAGDAGKAQQIAESIKQEIQTLN